jgi:hypothetical protein
MPPDSTADHYRALDAAARRIADQAHAQVNQTAAKPPHAGARYAVAYLLERVISLLEERF